MSALHEPDRLPEAGDQPKREPMLNYDWLGNMDDAAKGYVDNLREPLRSDPVVAGIALEAFKAGRNLPALELAKASTMIDKGVLAVVKTAKRSSLKKVGPVSSGGDYLEHECGGLIHETQDNFCPECGTMIVDQ